MTIRTGSATTVARRVRALTASLGRGPVDAGPADRVGAKRFEVRDLRPELMDQPGLDPARHLEALDALACVNRISGTASRIWRVILEIHGRTGRSVRVLDIACGGGDVVADIATRARRAGVPLEAHGCDVSALALEAARARSSGEDGVEFFGLDARCDPIPRGYDLLCSSLFLHHLPAGSATELLRRMASSTTSSILVQDLRRTRLGFLFAYFGLLALTRSDVARSDGLTSVRGAFTQREAKTLCADAGLVGAVVRPVWPQRFSILWSRP